MIHWAGGARAYAAMAPPKAMPVARPRRRTYASAIRATGLKRAPPIQSREAVEAVAAREPPNSARRAGRNTGKVLVIPATSSMVAKASQSRWLARDSRGGVTRE